MKIKLNRIFKLTVVLVFFVALFFQISHKVAYACTCLRPAPPLEAKEKADAVFSGTVISQERSEFEVKVNFRVQRIWKGEIDDTVTITTARSSAACGVNFRVREKYLVYAFSDQNELRTNLCSRTQILSRASEDLRALGSGSRPIQQNMGILNNSNWELYSLNDRRARATITAFFRNNKIRGNSGCNFYHGAYKEKGNAIKFSPIVTTEMACMEPDLQEIETNYLKALSDAYSFEIDRRRYGRDRLILDYYDGRNEGTLVYFKTNRR